MDHEQSTRPASVGGGRADAAATTMVAALLLLVPRFASSGTEVVPGFWDSIVSGPFGALMGACAWRARGVAALVLSSCAILPGLVAVALDEHLLDVLPSPPGGLAALWGLGFAGAAVGAWAVRGGRSGFAAAAWLLLLAGIGAGAAVGWGLLVEPPAFTPEWTALLLDLSPHGLVLECGGVDWIRSSSLYEAAGTDRIGPELRSSWSGSVAGPVLVVVGCTGLTAARARR